MATGVQVVFDCADPDRLARFWADALGYRLQDPPAGYGSWEDWARDQNIPEERWNDASAVVDPDGKGPRIYLQRVPEAKTVKNRVHLDLNISGGPSGGPLEERPAGGSTPRSSGSSGSARPGSGRPRSSAATGWSCRIPRATSSACTDPDVSATGRREGSRGAASQ